MALIVKKFGGSSVATPDKMRAIVQRVLKGKKPEDKIVIVVSAMGDTTDDLVALAKQITSKAYGREMDMLLTTGEQVSIALMAMAFQEAGQKAVSFTGAQAGIKTSDAFNKGRILALKPARIMKALEQDNIVVVAGFQGITGHGDITTSAEAVPIRQLSPLPALSTLMFVKFIPTLTAYTRPIPVSFPMLEKSIRSPTAKCWKWRNSAPVSCSPGPSKWAAASAFPFTCARRFRKMKEL